MPSQAYDETSELERLLEPFVQSPMGRRYRTAHWLKSDPESPIWIIELDTRVELDWRVPLPDGNCLTSVKHRELLKAFRSWLTVGSHVDTTGGSPLAPRSERARLQRSVHCIDYLLLRSEQLAILNGRGLGHLSSNDLVAMLAAIGSSYSISESIYGWSQKLTTYLRSRIEHPLPGHGVGCFEYPGIAVDIPDASDRMTSLDEAEIVLARAWLASTGCYKHSGSAGYRYTVLCSRLAAEIYRGTLFGRTIPFPVPDELCLGPNHRVRTEYPRARVTSEHDERMGEKSIARYAETVASLGLLKADGILVPSASLEVLRSASRTLNIKPIGRFRTLPYPVVFRALRLGIEFALTYGNDLVDSYLAVARKAHLGGVSVGEYCDEHDIADLVTPRCRELGIRRWTIEGTFDPIPTAEWFTNLRANVGLFETLRVLYGAVEVVVGTVMARRLGEFLDLHSDSCFDKSRTRLVFANRKSGIGGGRQTEERPIPPVAVELIELLQRLQRQLYELGAIDTTTNLFSYPRYRGDGWLVSVSKSSYSESLDYFCDWAELDLDTSGSRYYIRQHQLRRFFAMLFFWGGGFGGMDTLRWFLGHTDVEHLWHYISETTPGLTIRSVAAEWATYGVKHGTEEAKQLAAELSKHFGTSDFTVLDDEALSLHIEDLMEAGLLTIEPEFIDSGRQYRIAVVLRSGGAE